MTCWIVECMSALFYINDRFECHENERNVSAKMVGYNPRRHDFSQNLQQDTYMFVGKNRGNASEGCFRPLDTLILGTSEIGEMMRNCGRRKTLRWVGVRHFRSRTDEHAA